MCVSSSDRRSRRGQRGYTLSELIAVLVLTGVLAAFVMPKLGAGLSLRDDAWRDQVVAALRHAHQTAVSHRRLVCVSVGSTSVSVSVAATNPASSCTATLTGPDGSASFGSSASGNTATVSPAGALYFQPSGRVTSDGAGSTVSDRSVAFSGLDATQNITVVGETGHVR